MKKTNQRASETEEGKGRKRPEKAIYERDPAKSEQAPRKPVEQVHSKSLSIRFTRAEWASILQKAQRVGATPTAVIRAAVLDERLPAVVQYRLSVTERNDYRTLVNKFNGLSQLTAGDAAPSADTAELRDLLRQVLAAIVPPHIGQNQDAI